MRILVTDNKVDRIQDSQMLAALAKCGSVDIVHNGRDAVIAYVNTIAKGTFYDLIVMDHHTSVLDGFAAVEMIRMYELEHRKTGKPTMVCVISSAVICQHHFEERFGKDQRTHLLQKPVKPDLIAFLAGSVAAELEMESVPVCKRKSVCLQA